LRGSVAKQRADGEAGSAGNDCIIGVGLSLAGEDAGGEGKGSRDRKGCHSAHKRYSNTTPQSPAPGGSANRAFQAKLMADQPKRGVKVVSGTAPEKQSLRGI
jgi:hypothetical protein